MKTIETDPPQPVEMVDSKSQDQSPDCDPCMPVVIDVAPPALSPELERLFEISWRVYEADYRYLGR